MSDPVLEVKRSKLWLLAVLWILAGTAALALHLGGAAWALSHLQTDDGDDGLGANGAEYAVEMTSPKLPETDLPPGPDSEASQFQPQQMQQQAEVKETDLPIDLPTSSAQPQKKPDKPTYVSIKPDLTLSIGENAVKRTELVSSLDGISDMSKDKYVFLRADKAVPYGELMGVMEILRSGGYSRIKLVALEAPAAAAGPAQGAVQP